MTYDHRRGVGKQKKNKKWLIVLPSLFLIIGAYALVNVLAPAVPLFTSRPQDATAQKLINQKPEAGVNRLYIPQINIDVAVSDSDSMYMLAEDAWRPDSHTGSPADSGNFVLGAHRFKLGATPAETRSQSPFYYLDKLQNGDEVFVDYEGQRYVYKVTKKYEAPKDMTSFDASSTEKKLTLYSYDSGGPEPGSEVVEASPVGTVAWSGSKPFIKPTSQSN